MEGVEQPKRPSDAEPTDLADRVARFRADWAKFGWAALDAYLPPAAAPHRRAVLVELVRADMELTAASKRKVRLDPILARYPADLPRHAVPVSLLLDEYQLRTQAAERPPLDEYRQRFPDQYAAFADAVAGRPGAAADTVPPDDLGRTPVAPTLPVPGEAYSPPPPPPPIAADDVIPADLQYRVVRALGSGTFGEVYEAEAPGGFRVAIKRIHRPAGHATSRAELESLEAIKTVSHPFLLQTQAFWFFRDRLVIVMELAEGSLADRIEACRKDGLPGVPKEELVPYFEQAAAALDYLHSRSISHRDIKPENLLYLKGYAKVADFGLARVQRHTQTLVGGLAGTPLFMAPEVWGQEVSLHSDQYSLAVTYVFARTGRGVFESKLLHELALSHTQERPKLDGFPPAEQAVLRKALAKKPEDRYPSCRAFAAALREAVFPAPPPPPPTPGSRRSAGVAAVAGVVLACAALLAAFLLLRPPPDADPEPPPVVFWHPTGWEPVGGADLPPRPDGTRYPAKLTRTVAGRELVALPIPPKTADEPRLFYMTRDKITNDVFAAVWETAIADPKSAVSQSIRNLGALAPDLFPGKWKDGAVDATTGEHLKVAGRDAVPAVGVTMPEAALAAAELGGRLPTYNQWKKAVGALDDPDRVSSVGNPPYALDTLALNLPGGPWPVDRPTPDVSVFGVHQLVSNGYEWTRGEADGREVNPQEPPTLPPLVLVVGQSWDNAQVLTYQDITQGPRRTFNWNAADKGVGFRIVLEP